MGRRLFIIVLLAALAVGGTYIVRTLLGPAELVRAPAAARATPAPSDFTTLFWSDFAGSRVLGVNRSGETVFEQQLRSPPLPLSGYAVHTEYVTVAPNGNLIVADGEGMMVQELDRRTHALVWQYGVRGVQGSQGGFLHQPDKAYKLNDHEVLINDGNNRRVIVVDQRSGEIVWQYGETLRMGSAPGLLRGNTHALPVNGGATILITDTLEKKLLLVDRATKAIRWEWRKPDAQWLQHASATPEGSFLLEDRQKGEVFELSPQGEVLWKLDRLADGSPLRYPTDALKLGNGNVLIAEAGRSRVIEVSPTTREIVWQYGNGQPVRGARTGFVTAIAIDHRPP